MKRLIVGLLWHSLLHRQCRSVFSIVDTAHKEIECVRMLRNNEHTAGKVKIRTNVSTLLKWRTIVFFHPFELCGGSPPFSKCQTTNSIVAKLLFNGRNPKSSRAHTGLKTNAVKKVYSTVAQKQRRPVQIMKHMWAESCTTRCVVRV